MHFGFTISLKRAKEKKKMIPFWVKKPEEECEDGKGIVLLVKWKLQEIFWIKTLKMRIFKKL